MLEDRETDRLTEIVIESVIAVHRTLGPGFLESAYRNALEIELLDRGMKVEREKAVEAFNNTHYAQIRAYLLASGTSTGLLVNFAGHKADYRRVERGATK
jgi:hypothetical protein